MASSVSGMSNLDVNSIVSQLMAVERQPLQAIQKTLSGIQTKLSAIGQLQGKLAAFQDAAKALNLATTWTATRATSSDETSARVTAGATAVAGRYSLVVNRLAQRQTIAGAALASADAVVGSGTLTIQLGTWNTVAGTFTADAVRPAVAVTLPANATLAQVRDAINAKGAGVTATLVNDGTGTRLAIRSADTGATNAFKITGTGDAGVAALSFDPQAPLATSTRLTVEAKSAEVIVDGLTVASASNTLTDVIQGVTVELRKQDPAATIGIAVDTDTDALKSAITRFVSAWNDLNSTLANQTKYDAATKTAGTLQGNSAVVSVQRQLRGLLQSSVSGLALQRLSDAGIETQRDGSLTVNATKLDAALAAPAKLRDLFSATGTDTASQGLARRFDALLTSMLGTGGMVTGAADNLRAQQERTNDRQDAFEQRMTLVEARLRRQYTALDTQLSKFNSTSSFLTSKFG